VLNELAGIDNPEVDWKLMGIENELRLELGSDMLFEVSPDDPKVDEPVEKPEPIGIEKLFEESPEDPKVEPIGIEKDVGPEDPKPESPELEEPITRG